MPERFRGELLTMGRYTNPASFSFTFYLFICYNQILLFAAVAEKRSACEMAGDLYCLGDAGTELMPCIKLTGCV